MLKPSVLLLPLCRLCSLTASSSTLPPFITSLCFSIVKVGWMKLGPWKFEWEHYVQQYCAPPGKKRLNKSQNAAAAAESEKTLQHVKNATRFSPNAEAGQSRKSRPAPLKFRFRVLGLKNFLKMFLDCFLDCLCNKLPSLWPRSFKGRNHKKKKEKKAGESIQKKYLFIHMDMV